MKSRVDVIPVTEKTLVSVMSLGRFGNDLFCCYKPFDGSVHWSGFLGQFTLLQDYKVSVFGFLLSHSFLHVSSLEWIHANDPI